MMNKIGLNRQAKKFISVYRHPGLLLTVALLFLTATASAQMTSQPVQSFNTGWWFTASQIIQDKSGNSTGVSAKRRGLGNSWSDQFNVQTVDTKAAGGDSSLTFGNAKEVFSELQTKLKSASWKEVVLPHTAFIEPVPIENPQEGFAFYKKTFKVPAALKGKVIQLQFDGAMQLSDIWVNGKFACRHEGGYLPFSIDLTELLNYGGENTLFIRLDNRPTPLVPPGKPVKKLDFIYYSGIYRSVRLLVTDPLHITQPETIKKTGGGGVFIHYLGPADPATGVKITTDPSGRQIETVQNGQLKIRTSIINQDKSVRTFVVDQRLLTTGKSRQAGHWISHPVTLGPGRDTTVTQVVKTGKLRLWNLEDPYRYTLISSIKEAGKIIDQQELKTGFRGLSITKEQGVLINGKPVHINGSNRHMNYPWIGNALSRSANIRDAILIKNAGINAIRLAHYPQDPSFYEACDSLGILLIDCIPGWQFYNKATAFENHVMEDIRQMIYRDRNHPAVFLWETSLNEAYPPKDFRIRQAAAAHAGWQDSTDFYTSGDSYFTRAAWDVPYDDWNGDPGNRNNTTYPDKPFLIREYGDYEFGGGESTSRKSRTDGQAGMLQQAWNLQWEHNRNQLRYPACIGDMTWAFFDGLAGVTNIVEYWGMADLYRIPKFSYYFFQSQQRKAGKPMVYIADYWARPATGVVNSNTDESQSADQRKIIVYSNCDSIRLVVNGTPVTTRLPDNGPDRPYGTDLEKGGHPFTGGDAGRLQSPPFTFQGIPFSAGALTAEGYQNGKIVTRQTVYTPGRPVRIKLTEDDQGLPLKADGADAVFVRATLVDSAGHPVYTGRGSEPGSQKAAGNYSIHFSIRGEGRIISPATRVTEAGIASILVQATTKKGKISIQADDEGKSLKGDHLVIESK